MYYNLRYSSQVFLFISSRYLIILFQNYIGDSGHLTKARDLIIELDNVNFESVLLQDSVSISGSGSGVVIFEFIIFRGQSTWK